MKSEPRDASDDAPWSDLESPAADESFGESPTDLCTEFERRKQFLADMADGEVSPPPKIFDRQPSVFRPALPPRPLSRPATPLFSLLHSALPRPLRSAVAPSARSALRASRSYS
jgi:hypothetical protein